MADTIQNSPPVVIQSPPNPKLTRSQQLNKVYALPVPLRTFPLPTLVPHNPLSLFQILYTWLSQSISPPSSRFEPLYRGLWSPDTRSVHVTDDRSIRGLWEQGFFGKGTLSRSEPNWMKGQIARANKSRATSEEFTKQRREERQQVKWERARKEREAIDQKLLEEAGVVLKKEIISSGSSPLAEKQALVESNNVSTLLESNAHTWAKSLQYFPSPVGPVELLSLPNSAADLEKWAYDDEPASPSQLLEGVIINRANGSPNLPDTPHHGSQDLDGTNGSVLLNEIMDISSPNGSVLANGSKSPDKPRLKKQKSVRFSPNIEKSTFIQTEPPSPDQNLAPSTSTSVLVEANIEQAIQEQEHFQLMMEEAFFLSYSLGALSILDPVSNLPIPNQDLFSLFRKSSHFPPQSNPVLAPDDTFLINYVVYHHYRSLGWCVRGGAKFSCDFMLYNRGPVFSHAEFAILVIPSYVDLYWHSDPFLQNYVRGQENRSWSWMHCINRVISQVKKKLILVYVDVPRPLEADAEKELGIDELLGRYKVREFVMRRWLSNRERG